MRLYKPDAVMVMHGDGSCHVVDLMSDTVAAYSDAMIPLRFQGWSESVPEGANEAADRVLRSRGVRTDD